MAVRCGINLRASRSSKGSRTCWVKRAPTDADQAFSSNASAPGSEWSGRYEPTAIIQRTGTAPPEAMARTRRSRIRSSFSSSSRVVSKTYSLMKHWRARAEQKRNKPSSLGVAGPSAAASSRIARSPVRQRSSSMSHTGTVSSNTRNSSSSAIAARRPDKSSILSRVGHAAVARAQQCEIAGLSLTRLTAGSARSIGRSHGSDNARSIRGRMPSASDVNFRFLMHSTNSALASLVSLTARARVTAASARALETWSGPWASSAWTR